MSKLYSFWIGQGIFSLEVNKPLGLQITLGIESHEFGRIEYVCRFYSYERKLKKRYSETQDDYRKDNKALRSVIFITKFTKI